MMAVEFLGQVLVGSDTVEDEGMGTPAMIRQGVTIIAIRADIFRHGGRLQAAVRRDSP